MEYLLFWVNVVGLNFELATKDNQLATFGVCFVFTLVSLLAKLLGFYFMFLIFPCFLASVQPHLRVLFFFFWVFVFISLLWSELLLLFALVFFPFLASGVHIFGFNDSFFRDTIGGGRENPCKFYERRNNRWWSKCLFFYQYFYGKCSSEGEPWIRGEKWVSSWLGDSSQPFKPNIFQY